MKVINCIQGSEEWHQARLGKITASRVHDILPGKSGYKAARKNYKAQLISEILTRNYQETYASSCMQYGKEMEQIARSAYEAQIGNFIKEVGFIISDELDYLGCSPDGILESKGIEFKCPNTATHIDTIEKYMDGKKRIKPEYYTQIQTSMLCTGFDEWDFVSYDNRLPGKMQLYIDTIGYDEKYCKLILSEVIKFRKELMETLEKLGRYQQE